MTHSKNIYCPNCKRKIGRYDGKSTVIKCVKCRKCRKLICYYPDKDEIKVKPVPPRTTASGMTFI